MANTIDQAFITQFESEVHLVFQKQASRLKGTCRTANVNGSVVRFQVIGKGGASQKTRNADVTVMSAGGAGVDVAHSFEEATMADWYAAEYVDKLDELKININERQALASSEAYALGRKCDEIVIAAIEADATDAGLLDLTTADGASAVFRRFGEQEVPDDGMRFCAVSHKGWIDLMGIPEFANMDYIMPDQATWANGATAKRWLGINWMTDTQLTNTAGGTDLTTGLAWHSRAVGIGMGVDITTEVNYVPEKVAHLITSYISLGAVVIDATGAFSFTYADTGPLA
jgi:hypothetical protein